MAPAALDVQVDVVDDHRSHRGERAVEVAHQIRFGLDADRQTHQVVADAELLAHARGRLACVMIAGCSINDSTPPRLSASANTRTDCRNRRVAVEAAGNVARQHAAVAGHLPLRERVLRMARQAR